MYKVVRSEFSLIVGVLTVLFFMLVGGKWLEGIENLSYPLILFLFVWLFTVMLMASFKVVQHADMLAVKLGEPYGTLILTLSVITIEVSMISAVMLVGDNNPTLGRDMMFSVIMIVMNGLVGLSLLIGAGKHFEQSYNLQGVNSFLVITIPLVLIGLVLPNYTESSAVGTYTGEQKVFVISITLLLYVAFLVAQTIRHKEYFVMSGESDEDEHHKPKSLTYHVIFLFIYMLIIVLLSKKLAVMIDYFIQDVGAPSALGGFLVAILVLSPEGLASIRSAQQNNLQRSINICMGSALATIGLTVPAVLLIGMVTGEEVVLGLASKDSFLLVLTMGISIVNFSSTKSNVLQGLVHITLFILYIMLIFD